MEKFIELVPVEAVAWLCVVLIIGTALALISEFWKRPRAEKLALVQEWLLWAVARAESYLGGGRGEQKLAMVYSWFQTRFPVLCKLVTFDQFKKMVDDALDQLEEFLIDEAIMDMILRKVEENESAETVSDAK